MRVDLPPGGGEMVLPSSRRPRDEVRFVTDEQDALRRLATSVSRNARPEEIFAAVAEEIRPLVNAEDCAVLRFEPDATATIVAAGGDSFDGLAGDARVELDDNLTTGLVARTGR